MTAVNSAERSGRDRRAEDAAELGAPFALPYSFSRTAALIALPANMRRRAAIRHVSVFLVALFVWGTLAYFASIVVRARAAYAAQKSGRGWTGRVHCADPELGLRPVPNARGGETFSIGPDVPTAFDADGFRVPVDATASDARPLVLAIGCSFTFGSACTAEETFPFLVARELGGSAKNAGCSSYGLAQMLLTARRLVPRWKPDIVLFQYSTWLVERSRDRKAPTYIGDVPTPFFEAAPDGVRLREPLYPSIVFDLPVGEYLHGEKSSGDFIGFVRRVALPLFVHDDLRALWSRATATTYAPADGAEIIERVYSEVADVCAKNGARLVVVVLERAGQDVALPESIRKLGCTSVLTARVLKAELPDSKLRTYVERYEHWRGDPPVLVDGHPNALAHSIIARSIVEAIRAKR